MSEMKFTPGPWSIHAINPATSCTYLQISGANHPIGRVESGKWGDPYLSIRQVGPSLDQKFEPYMELIEYGEIPKEVALANARLIAAAPAMYEALKAITMIAGNLPDETLESCGGINEGRGRALMALRARSIARAALASVTEGKGV
jgi:hypothetical protein